MDTDRLESFYEGLNFEIVEIDDRETLFFELSDEGDYATVTDEEGALPSSLESPIIFSVYDTNDAFQWSVTLEDSESLKEIFHRFESTDDLLNNLKDIRLENIAKAEN